MLIDLTETLRAKAAGAGLLTLYIACQFCRFGC